MENRQRKSWKEIQPELETGDLILFHGMYTISRVVEFIEQDDWSHVGMVIKLNGRPLLWESTTFTNLPDEIYHDRIEGPKIVDLHDRLKTYDASYDIPLKYAVRPLRVERTEEMKMAIYQEVFRTHGKKCPVGMEMIFNYLEGKLLNIPANSKMECSQLVASAYMAMGLIPDSRVPNSYNPADFSQKYNLKLLKGKLDDEILIDIQ